MPGNLHLFLTRIPAVERLNVDPNTGPSSMLNPTPPFSVPRVGTDNELVLPNDAIGGNSLRSFLCLYRSSAVNHRAPASNY